MGEINILKILNANKEVGAQKNIDLNTFIHQITGQRKGGGGTALKQAIVKGGTYTFMRLPCNPASFWQQCASLMQ